MQIKILISVLIISCFACQNEEEDSSGKTGDESKAKVVFDETKWKTKKGRDYPFRDSMLEELISNESFRELKKDDVLDVLGEPDRIDNDYLFYRIFQKRVYIFPLHTKTLVIKFSGDGAIEWMKIHE